jgi:hypothetical protein
MMLMRVPDDQPADEPHDGSHSLSVLTPSHNQPVVQCPLHPTHQLILLYFAQPVPPVQPMLLAQLMAQLMPALLALMRRC